MKAWQKYQANEIMTSSPIKNTIYIYERCIIEFKKLEKLSEKFKYKEVDEILEKLEKVFEELELQLNSDVDEDLYESISSLYEWISEQIKAMKRTRQATDIDAIIYVLTQLIEGYKGVLENV
jgi:flagellar protein FliS